MVKTPRRLTYHEAEFIRGYLAVHKWRGATMAMANKFGVDSRTVRDAFNGKTHTTCDCSVCRAKKTQVPSQ